MTEKMNEELKNEVFKVTQEFLKSPPLIIWGSGATISFGLPSMQDLNEELKNKIDGFNSEAQNLEQELKEEKYKNQIPQIKKTIWEKVNAADIKVMDKIISSQVDEFKGIRSLIETFIETHPKVLNIVTTNYDRVLEYILSYYNYSFTDGFNGKVFSSFNEELFIQKNIINLIKVHGSLNWFEVNGKTRFLSEKKESKTAKIIVPDENKYQEAYLPPYRELIQKADSFIQSASSFFVIGFGFNDEHLTPRIKAKLQEGTPIVLITKTVSANAREELQKASKYIYFEENESGKTKIVYKNHKTDKKEIELEGKLWQLKRFMNEVYN